MAVLIINDKKSSDGKRDVTYEIEGNGLVEVRYGFLNWLDSGIYRREGDAFIFRQFRLEIKAQSKNLNGAYLCKLIDTPDPKAEGQ